ncbi:MAG: peptide-methionine (R)-S-oxide reductase MsrB [Chitinophagaceae bacterium]|nr:peptide-methionine (R)-S-oxide reductase MsrB [Chitinophagaceae bacterium]
MKSLIFIIAIINVSPCYSQTGQSKKVEKIKDISHMKDEDWKKKLTAEEYYVLREKGTERAFTGEYWDNHEKGIFSCAGCELDLFDSQTKYESGTGWPSFWDVVKKENVKEITDTSHGMTRTEVVCARCGGHLGHLFPDGPNPTGNRYCINSVSLKLKKNKKQ